MKLAKRHLRKIVHEEISRVLEGDFEDPESFDEPDPGYPQNIPPIASDSDYRANENIYNLAMKAQSADRRDEWKELIDICAERARAWEDLSMSKVSKVSKDSMADEEAGI